MLRYVPLFAALAVAPAKAADPVSLTVTTAQIVSRELSPTVRGIGVIQPRREVKVYPEVSGVRIMESSVEVGDTVALGQVIAGLDPRSARNALAKAAAAVKAAETEEVAAEAAIERARRLAANGAVSMESVETLEAAASRAASALLEARAQLRDAEIDVAKTEVVATSAGTVMSVDQKQGEVAQAASALVTIAADGVLEAVAMVPERWIAKLSPGNRTLVAFQGGRTVEGEVRLVDPNIDAETHMGKVHVSVPQGPGLKKGLFARVSIATPGRPALWVPAKSIAWRADGAKVFLLEDGVVKEVAVKAGDESGGLVPVDGDLAAGQSVVVAGAGFLHDGDRVGVADESAE